MSPFLFSCETLCETFFWHAHIWAPLVGVVESIANFIEKDLSLLSSVEYGQEPVEEREPMTKLFIFVGMILGGWIGWWIGSYIGIWPAYLLSSAGSIMGVYFGWRIARNLMD